MTRYGIFCDQIQLSGLDIPPCIKDLQHLKQEGIALCFFYFEVNFYKVLLIIIS